MINRIAQKFPNRAYPSPRIQIPFAVLFFLVSLLLVYPQFLPSLDEINPYDESVYINNGRLLVDQGSLPDYAGNPLTSIFYAITYLPYHHSSYWLIQSCTLGRILLFSLLWWSTYLIATRLSEFAPPAILIGLIFLTPLAVQMLGFPSDPMFAGLAALSFWQLLCYKNEEKIQHLWLASTFMGFAALARNDGLVLFLILLGFSLWLSIRRKQGIHAFVAILMPFAILVGGYILLYGIFTGNYDPGVSRRTYDNFEAGQQVVYSGTGEFNVVPEAKLEARRFFGTPLENHFSAFAAIRRNPTEYLHRLVALLKGLPEIFLNAYGIRFAALLLLFAAGGIVELVRRKQFILLAILCLWPVHLVTGLVITLIRPGHLMFPFYILFALAAIGLAALLRAMLEKRPERFVWYSLLAGIAAWGWLDQKLAIFYGAFILLLGLWIISALAKHPFAFSSPQSTALLILLCAGVIIRGGYPSPKIRSLGTSAREQAVVTLASALEPGAKVATAAPGPVMMAKMQAWSLIAADLPRTKDSEEFTQWMKSRGVRAIYVDENLYNNNPQIWGLIEPQIGKQLKRIFAGDQGDIQILVFK